VELFVVALEVGFAGEGFGLGRVGGGMVGGCGGGGGGVARG
jgi:hypothetical protein